LIGLRKAQNEALGTDTSIEKQQLAEEAQLLQTAIKKREPLRYGRLAARQALVFISLLLGHEHYLARPDGGLSRATGANVCQEHILP